MNILVADVLKLVYPKQPWMKNPFHMTSAQRTGICTNAHLLCNNLNPSVSINFPHIGYMILMYAWILDGFYKLSP